MWIATFEHLQWSVVASHIDHIIHGFVIFINYMSTQLCFACQWYIWYLYSWLLWGFELALFLVLLVLLWVNCIYPALFANINVQFRNIIVDLISKYDIIWWIRKLQILLHLLLPAGNNQLRKLIWIYFFGCQLLLTIGIMALW